MISDELYDQAWRMMPIPCVDLLVTNRDHLVLLLRRRNEPAKGHRWFPGNRVLYGETRANAALRKLREECGLRATAATELATYDLTLPMASGDPARHCITTPYHVCPEGALSAGLDGQSTASMWKTGAQWEREGLHPFVACCLGMHLRASGGK